MNHYAGNEDESVSSGTSTKRGSDDSPENDYARDEVKAIQQSSQLDNRRIRAWRVVMLMVILATAVAVSVTTYDFLVDERDYNFRTAFEGLASTIETATLEQQKNIREGFLAMSNVMTGYAQQTNTTWPFVSLPYFEMYAANLRKQSRIEAFWITNRVEHKDLQDYIDFVDERYVEDVAEGFEIDPSTKQYFEGGQYHDYLHIKTSEGFVKDFDREEYYPLYQQSPPMFNYLLVNYNLQGIQDYVDIINASLVLQNETIYTRIRPYSAFTDKDHARLHSSRLQDETVDHPHSFVYYPIHEEVANTSSRVVGFVQGAAAWDTAIRNLIPDDIRGLYAVINNSCNQTFTYELVGAEAFFLGYGDLHEKEYDDMGFYVDLMGLHHHPDFDTTLGHCRYYLTVYPGKAFYAIYDTNTPELFVAIVSVTFFVMVVVFVIYDILVQRRNQKLIWNAAQSNAIVSNMFPSQIRDRLIGSGAGSAHALKSYMRSPNQAKTVDQERQVSRPMADLFLDTTIIFADIVGFTAWSSTREPPQVFELLETVYSEFDKISEKRNVFKVETVGDCYVAVTGMPDARADHATAMVRFARQILDKFSEVTRELELCLGPDTADLSLRIGIHSGPVTAGVLRGTRARFQLFGDTMNTTQRIESSGAPNRIHISPVTANFLIAAGKQSWIQKRDDIVTIRGKSDMVTYWVVDELGPTDHHPNSTSPISSPNNTKDRIGRLVEWNVATLLRLLKEIVARREALSGSTRAFYNKSDEAVARFDNNPLHEVVEIIKLPEFQQAKQMRKEIKEVTVNPTVVEQLRLYVCCVANMYRDNAFHNFEHASHVTMSVTKLLSRIVAPTELELNPELAGEAHLATLHDHTYGITSDPLTQFACAFSALVHDLDHTGAPNAQLIKEGSTQAKAYGNRSVAEQNSLCLAWDLLFEAQFTGLRNEICATQAEQYRFRQLVVNSVMATDIADKDLKKLRNNRWDKAFNNTLGQEESHRDSVNRKATIVIEHLIQASDVSHTMQHWHVYRKWNEHLFRETYAAFQQGRAETDPAINWYKGEIGFFDFYVIPLAKKLKDCGVFGKSSDEYLNYALQNRSEWVEKGQQVVAQMVEKVKN